MVQLAKVKQLAELIRVSKKTVLYTGAGISASAVGQAARSGQNTVGWKAHPSEAKPTPTHFALGVLGRHGLVHSWCQQNHDGLPQKAGFPQELLNEVHGSWFNPSNPVVKYTGSLHTPCYEQMLDDAKTADLVLVLGTSLGGLNADQIVTRAADRSLKPSGDDKDRPKSLGSVCINLQQTPQDGKMTLRLFGKSDDYLILLLRELGLEMPSKKVIQSNIHWPSESRVLVPYDKNGRRLKSFETGGGAHQTEEEEPWMWLDLKNGSKVKLVQGHNCEGSDQPQFKKITHGRGSVIKRNEASCAFHLEIEGAPMKLGLWWLDSAVRGAVEELPIVNICPQFQHANAVYESKTTKSNVNKVSSVCTKAKASKK
jgi:NAD-dependent SIR2 family protein deacetylase